MPTAGARDVDRGWAWVVLCGTFFAVFLNGFMGYSVGVVTAAMLDKYDEGLAKTSAVGSLMVAMQCLSGPGVGLVINKLGCRTTTFLGGILGVLSMMGAAVSTSLDMVLVTFGLLMGLSLGLGYIPAVVVVGHYFHRFGPFASGVTVAGGGLGMIVGPPFVRFVLDHYGLNGTFLILGGLCLHFCAIGLLMRVSPVEMNKNPRAGKMDKRWNRKYLQCFCSKKLDKSPQEEKFTVDVKEENTDSLPNGVKRKNKKEMIKDVFSTFTQGSFMCFVLSIAFWNAGESATLVHFPNYIQIQGFSKQHAASLYIIMGLANIPSRLLTGIAANDENISSLSLLTGQMGLAAILTMTFPLYSGTYMGQVLFVVGLGLYISGINSLMNPITVELLGVYNLATGFGIVMLLAGVGYLSAAPIAGMIADSTGSYTLSYIFAGSLYLLSSLFGLLSAFLQTPPASVADRSLTIVAEDTGSHDGADEIKSMLDGACEGAS